MSSRLKESNYIEFEKKIQDNSSKGNLSKNKYVVIITALSYFFVWFFSISNISCITNYGSRLCS